MEYITSSDETINLYSIPINALNDSTRIALSEFLDPEQPLCSSHDVPRDFRGLVEQLDLDHNAVGYIQKSEKPTRIVLEAWERKPNNSIGLFIQYLEKMERHDIIEDITPKFEKDAMSYLRKKKYVRCDPIATESNYQSTNPVPRVPIENNNLLTRSDIQTGSSTLYDAYVCYDKADYAFVEKLSNCLESGKYGCCFKLFIKDRDLLAGSIEPGALTQLINDRCRCMLVILSPQFVQSPECEFQTNFATTIAIDQRARKIIPLIIEPCDMPNVLMPLSKLDFVKPVIQNWTWGQLIDSIGGSSHILSNCNPQISPMASFCGQPQIECNETSHAISFPNLQPITNNLWSVLQRNEASNPVVTFPPTSQHPSMITYPLSNESAVSTVKIPDSSSLLTATTTTSKTVENSNYTKSKWYNKFIKFNKKLSSPFSKVLPSSGQSSTSTATSGFHSHTSSFESKEELESRIGGVI